jgi:hypothetical protein
MNQNAVGPGESGSTTPQVVAVPHAIELPYRRLRAVLWAITIAVIVLGVFRELYVGAYGPNTVLGPMFKIALDSENAVGEWWSTLQFTLAALLLAVNGITEPNGRWTRHWWVLAAIFIISPSMNPPACTRRS